MTISLHTLKMIEILASLGGSISIIAYVEYRFLKWNRHRMHIKDLIKKANEYYERGILTDEQLISTIIWINRDL